MRRILQILVVLTVAVLGWGYWHARTHASIQVTIQDTALRNDRQAYGVAKAARIELLDSEGKVLAVGATSGPYGVVWMAHPYLGDCTRFSGEEWQACFGKTAVWIPTWIERVRSATVTLPVCRIEKLPVHVREYGDTWWLWWVPLPHVGGRPYTLFDVALRVDSGRCAAAGL